MPMNFPDLKSLRAAFDHAALLPFIEGETEADYRERCAVWSEVKWDDFIQAREIRTGKGWDKWDDPGEALRDILPRMHKS